MEVIETSALPQIPQKRGLSDIDLNTVGGAIGPHSPHSMDSSATNGTVTSRILSRQGSPAMSTTSSLTSVSTLATPPPMIMGFDGTTDPAPHPAKRRKLTLQEKDERRREKEEKEKVREEAKQVKDEERRIKNEAREEKRREKELKDQQKEEEKRKKQEAIDKKERVSRHFQPRLHREAHNYRLNLVSLHSSRNQQHQVHLEL
jgi:chromatin assembly factor 1 subunit A